MNAKIDLSQIVLKTDRLILRSWQESDLDDFYEYASIKGVGEMAGWSHHQNKEETRQILKTFIEEKKTFAIVYQNKVIGSIGLEIYRENDLDGTFQNLMGREIGYVLNKKYWGQGIMPEAVNRVIQYCFNDLHLDFLCCGYFKENKQSKRVNEKIGFQYYKDVIHRTRYGVDKDTILTVLYNKK